MAIITAKELLEAGAHFGARVSRWNPKMAPYIYAKRNRTHVIDVRKTIQGVVEAYYYLERESRAGGQFLFVGTKRQARNAVRHAAEACGMHQVSERWLGGTLTNLRTIRERVARLEELEAMEADGRLRQHSKKMIASLNRERRKINRNLAGIRNMKDLPTALIVVDPRKENIAVQEAGKLGIPIIALLDTDCDPDPVDVVIPCNDDSSHTIASILNALAGGILAGRGRVGMPTAAEPVVTEGGASFGGEGEEVAAAREHRTTIDETPKPEEVAPPPRGPAPDQETRDTSPARTDDQEPTGE
jgi:small subunit ribosomal protein S2